ncbi:hypothetical protein IAT38_005195 [Cryptococcus sp. DSM 104549]
MSYRVVPPTAQSSNDAHVISNQATAHPVSGTHDSFRYGLTSEAQSVANGAASPLQARLQKWSDTQLQLQQTLQRNTFGLSVPMKQAMEVKLVSKTLHNPLLDACPLGGSHNLSLEILQGRDESLDVEDYMGAGQNMAEVLDVNGALERSRGI